MPAIRAVGSPTFVQGLLYGLPNASIAMLWTPLNVMQGIYIKYYGISMGLLAAIMLASRVYDAFADVLAGAVSDWVKEKTRRRKPLFAAGAIVFAVTAALVYLPPDGVEAIYLSITLFAFFTGFAVFTLPYLAWGSELARGSAEKTRLFSFRVWAGYVGLCAFYSIPLFVHPNSSEITPETLRLAVYGSIGFLIPALLLTLRFVPEAPPTTMRRSALSVAALTSIVKNKPFILLMLAFVLSGLGMGIWYGMIFVFVDIYLKKGALYAPLYLFAFAVAAFATLAWSKVSEWIGKKRAWSLGAALMMLTAAVTCLLTPKNANIYALAGLILLNTVGFVTLELLVGSILGDVVDYATLRQKTNQAATYFAVFMFLAKVVFALGGAIGLGGAAILGFAPEAPVQSPKGVLALTVVMSLVPSILLGLSILAIQAIPINERRHLIIRRRLDQLEERRHRDAAE